MIGRRCGLYPLAHPQDSICTSWRAAYFMAVRSDTPGLSSSVTNSVASDWPCVYCDSVSKPNAKACGAAEAEHKSDGSAWNLANALLLQCVHNAHRLPGARRALVGTLSQSSAAPIEEASTHAPAQASEGRASGCLPAPTFTRWSSNAVDPWQGLLRRGCTSPSPHQVLSWRGRPTAHDCCDNCQRRSGEVALIRRKCLLGTSQWAIHGPPACRQ